jgi:hypothetical protein
VRSPGDGVVVNLVNANAGTVEKHPSDRHTARSWLADQLLEPTKLVFAVVIAESLRDYRQVLTSPIRHDHFIATLALIGIYLTTVWSWRGWHAAHVKAPYKVDEGRLVPSETYRFYADLAIVIAYAYTLFQVEPLVREPKENIVWLLIGYPVIVALYGVENILRRSVYGRDQRRTVPIGVTLLAHLAVALGYLIARRELTPAPHDSHDLLWLNGVTLTVVIVVMWGYRQFNEWYKENRINAAS